MKIHDYQNEDDKETCVKKILLKLINIHKIVPNSEQLQDITCSLEKCNLKELKDAFNTIFDCLKIDEGIPAKLGFYRLKGGIEIEYRRPFKRTNVTLKHIGG